MLEIRGGTRVADVDCFARADVEDRFVLGLWKLLFVDPVPRLAHKLRQSIESSPTCNRGSEDLCKSNWSLVYLVQDNIKQTIMSGCGKTDDEARRDLGARFDTRGVMQSRHRSLNSDSTCTPASNSLRPTPPFTS